MVSGVFWTRYSFVYCTQKQNVLGRFALIHCQSCVLISQYYGRVQRSLHWFYYILDFPPDSVHSTHNACILSLQLLWQIQRSKKVISCNISALPANGSMSVRTTCPGINKAFRHVENLFFKAGVPNLFLLVTPLILTLTSVAPHVHLKFR